MANEVKELLEKNKSQLNRYYDFVNTTTSESGFFKAVAEYVRMIVNSEVLDGLLKIYLLSDRDELVNKLNELSQTVLEDSLKVFEEIKKKIKDNKVENDWVASEVTEVENLISGKIKIISTGSGNYSIHFLQQIDDILVALKESGFKEISQDYEQTGSANNFIGWKISDHYDELYKLTKKIKEQGQRSVWGAWEKIYWAYATNLKKDETLKQYDESVHQMDIYSLTKDMDEILSGKRDPNEHNFFADKDEFRESLGLAHMRIIDGIDELISKAEELEKEGSVEKPIEPEIEKIIYDEANHSLIIGSHSIKFNKDDSNQAELCKILFASKQSANKSWNTEEILEAWDYPEDRIYDENSKLLKENRLKAYQTAEKINNKAMKVTEGKIIDLLIYSTKTVSINQKYRERIEFKKC